MYGYLKASMGFLSIPLFRPSNSHGVNVLSAFRLYSVRVCGWSISLDSIPF